MTTKPEPFLLLDDCRGIYLPQDFAWLWRDGMEVEPGFEDDLAVLLQGPDHEHYWEAWDNVLNGTVTLDGGTYTLHQDGDLWCIPEGMLWDDLEEWFFWPSPMHITLSQSDDDDGMVTVYCDSQAQARLDQAIDGSRWECPRDMDVAYASVTDRPTLVEELKAEGYEVDDSEYSQPDAADMARWAAKLEGSE